MHSQRAHPAVHHHRQVPAPRAFQSSLVSELELLRASCELGRVAHARQSLHVSLDPSRTGHGLPATCVPNADANLLAQRFYHLFDLRRHHQAVVLRDLRDEVHHLRLAARLGLLALVFLATGVPIVHQDLRESNKALGLRRRAQANSAQRASHVGGVLVRPASHVGVRTLGVRSSRRRR